MESPDTTRPDASSPLRIIALFIALSEALATAGAIATDGTARMMLTGFAVVFPFVVLAMFVWLLVVHTEKLYAPHQYAAGTTIEDFANATRGQYRDNQLILRSAMSQAVATAVSRREVPGASTSADVREQIVAEFDQAIEAATVTLVRRLVIDDAENVPIPVTNETTVQDLLNSAYFALAPAVGPYTYGVEWVLVRGDHEVLPDIGSNWADRKGLDGDHRSLADVGIRAGTAVTAVRRGHRKFR